MTDLGYSREQLILIVLFDVAKDFDATSHTIDEVVNYTGREEDKLYRQVSYGWQSLEGPARHATFEAATIASAAELDRRGVTIDKSQPIWLTTDVKEVVAGVFQAEIQSRFYGNDESRLTSREIATYKAQDQPSKDRRKIMDGIYSYTQAREKAFAKKDSDPITIKWQNMSASVRYQVIQDCLQRTLREFDLSSWQPGAPTAIAATTGMTSGVISYLDPVARSTRLLGSIIGDYQIEVVHGRATHRIAFTKLPSISSLRSSQRMGIGGLSDMSPEPDRVPRAPVDVLGHENLGRNEPDQEPRAPVILGLENLKLNEPESDSDSDVGGAVRGWIEALRGVQFEAMSMNP